MATIYILGGLLVVGMAYQQDAQGCVRLVTVIITVRGLTWLCKKVVASIDLDHSQFIDFAGWSLAGVSLIGLLKLAIQQANALAQASSDAVNKFQSIMDFVDNLTPWD